MLKRRAKLNGGSIMKKSAKKCKPQPSGLTAADFPWVIRVYPLTSAFDLAIVVDGKQATLDTDSLCYVTVDAKTPYAAREGVRQFIKFSLTDTIIRRSRPESEWKVIRPDGSEITLHYLLTDFYFEGCREAEIAPVEFPPQKPQHENKD